MKLKARVLMLGTSLDGRGGVAAVVSVLREGGLFEHERVRCPDRLIGSGLRERGERPLGVRLAKPGAHRAARSPELGPRGVTIEVRTIRAPGHALELGQPRGHPYIVLGGERLDEGVTDVRVQHRLWRLRGRHEGEKRR